MLDQWLRRMDMTGATYYGVCLVNGPGGWTRAGPTWQLRTGNWVCVGPGVAKWGTTKGLAELASEAPLATEWHAVAATIAPDPHLVIPCIPGSGVLSHPDVARLAEEADAATG
jgi:hypothetical protein